MGYLLNPFHGQINRSNWWLLQILIFAFAFAGIICAITFASDPNLPTDQRSNGESVIFLLVIVGVIYMNFATCLNRLRDSRRSGFWYLTFMLPTVGTGLMIYFCGIEAGRD
jgi:uncharacterized membrane protein YhaH (DUF805 family)